MLETKKIVKAHDLQFELLISNEEVQKKVLEMGQQIAQKHKDNKPVFLSILNGAFMFMADLCRAFEHDCEISFIKLNSYVGTESTGKINTLIGLETDLKDRHVVIVEDIIDTGQTLHFFIPQIQAMQPASVSIASFLVKTECIKHPLDIEYTGFEIPEKFVIGYGLDYNELGRNHRGIYQLIK